jgi:3-oxoacyl-[acyl-carrier protein] reductase
LADSFAGVRDRNVLITGAGRGIGKRLAIGFAAAGARVALLARTSSELELARLEIEHAGGETLTLQADVRDMGQLAAANERIRAEFGGTHILICAAAVLGPIGPLLHAPLAAWKDAIDTGLMGVVHACRAVLPQMMERRSGKIIVLAGGGASSSRPFVTGHAVAKAAVVRFVESLAEEVQDHNIQINCLDPGASYTSMTDEILRAGHDAGVKEAEEAQRIRVTGGTPAEKQIQMALFLASPRSNHISGKLLLASEEPKKLEHLNMLPDLYTLRRQVKG